MADLEPLMAPPPGSVRKVIQETLEDYFRSELKKEGAGNEGTVWRDEVYFRGAFDQVDLAAVICREIGDPDFPESWRCRADAA
jgi:hypothetical protein